MHIFYTNRMWIIYCSFFFSIILQIVPLFAQLWYIQPSWIMLTMIYWVMIVPKRINIGTGFILGIILDLILGITLGVHSFSFSILTYLIIKKMHFLKYISIYLQSFMIIVFSLINQIITFFVIFFITKNIVVTISTILWTCILDSCIWFILLFLIHKKFYINGG